MIIKILDSEKELETAYEKYVHSNHKSTVYHTLEWKRATEQNFGYKAMYLAAVSEKDVIHGVLPLFLVKNLREKKLVSVPLRDRCGPLYDNEEALISLLNKAKELCKQNSCSYLEIDMIEELPEGIMDSLEFKKKAALIRTKTSLKGTEEELWKRLDKSSVRSSISKSQRSDVKVLWSEKKEDVGIFYDLFVKTRKKLGSLSYSKSFFESLWDQFHKKGLMHLVLAKRGNEFIAGVIVFSFNKTIIDAYAASEEKYLELRPNNLILWDILKWGNKKGYHDFDFGADPASCKGLLDFKSRWGSEQEKIPYYYYLNTAKTTPSPELVGSGLITVILKHMPLFLHKIVGPIVIKYMV